MREAHPGFPHFPLFFTLSPPIAMSLSEQIEKEYIQAYKAKDSVRLAVLRLLKTAAKNRLVEFKRPGGALSDAEMLDVIIKEGKQRQDSIEQYTAANRADLADKEAAELKILQEYLPKALSREELAEIIETTITELQAAAPKDMGRVISAIMAAHKGRVDGKILSEAVKKRLSLNCSVSAAAAPPGARRIRQPARCPPLWQGLRRKMSCGALPGLNVLCRAGAFRMALWLKPAAEHALLPSPRP